MFFACLFALFPFFKCDSFVKHLFKFASKNHNFSHSFHVCSRMASFHPCNMRKLYLAAVGRSLLMLLLPVQISFNPQTQIKPSSLRVTLFITWISYSAPAQTEPVWTSFEQFYSFTTYAVQSSVSCSIKADRLTLHGLCQHGRQTAVTERPSRQLCT